VKAKDYSYVEAALTEGYSIFTYDRLGTGKSDKPDAYDIVQTSVQVEILRQLTLLARSGKLVSSSKRTSGSADLGHYTPSKIVHVGHSFGSVATASLLTGDGTLSDGVILTGFLYNSQLGGPNTGVASWGFEYAPESDPRRFKDRSSGYIVQATKSNVQLSFLKKGAFEPALLDYAEKIKQPASVSEFLSLGAVLAPKPVTTFKGPVQVSVQLAG
jgi:pimeloyl-ACP methyl ester carboxylesterase